MVLASASATSAATSTGDAASSGAGGGAGATTSGSSEDKLDRTGLCRLLFRELDQNGDGSLDMEEMRVSAVWRRVHGEQQRKPQLSLVLALWAPSSTGVGGLQL